MPIFAPKDLAEWTDGTWSVEPEANIQGFSIDSRSIMPGALFVAIRAERDGHAFIQAAIEAGAVAVMVDHWIEGLDVPQLLVKDTIIGLQDCARRWRSGFKGTVIGLTGSCGKTSTKEMLRSLLADRGVYATKGNLNNYLGAALSILELDASIHQYGVIELGINRVGEMDTLARMLKPDVGIVTMIGPAHLEGLGSIEGVAEEKSKLLDAVSEDGFSVYPERCLSYAGFENRVGKTGCHFLVREIEAGKRYAAKTFTTNYTISESMGSNAWLVDSNSSPEGPIELQLLFGDRSFLSLGKGEGSLGIRSNWTIAATVAARLGVPALTIEEVSRNWKPGANRGEMIEFKGTRFFLDGYNANPASMLDSMDYFAKRFVGESRFWVIAGMHELGTASGEWHQRIGSALRLNSDDRAVFVGEFAPLILEGALQAGNDRARMTVVERTDEVAELIDGFAGVVFLKGSRFYRLESLVGGVKKKEAGKC